MHDFVRDWVLPETAGQGVGYALLANAGGPLEVNVMVSHSWNENVVEFLEALERSVSGTDVMFICALGLFQNGDGSGPTIAEQLGTTAEESPFSRVLEHISRVGRARGWRWRQGRFLQVLPTWLFIVAMTLYSVPLVAERCLPYRAQCLHLDSAVIWHGFLASRDKDAPAAPAMEELTAASKACWLASLAIGAIALLCKLGLRCVRLYTGRMVAVPNRQDDLYSRLWCVYEIFTSTTKQVPVELAWTMASAGICSCREATCTEPADQRRICLEIAEWGLTGTGYADHGFEMVDYVIAKTTRSARWAFVHKLSRWGLMIGLLNLQLVCAMSSSRSDQLLTLAVLPLVLVAVGTLGYRVASHKQGYLSCCQVWLSSAVLALLSLAALAVIITFIDPAGVGPGSRHVPWASSHPVLYHGGIMVFITGVFLPCVLFCRCKLVRSLLRFVVAPGLALPFILFLWHSLFGGTEATFGVFDREAVVGVVLSVIEKVVMFSFLVMLWLGADRFGVRVRCNPPRGKALIERMSVLGQEGHRLGTSAAQSAASAAQSAAHALGWERGEENPT